MIKKIIKNKGYTISALAAQLGITQQTLSSQIANVDKLNFARVKQLAAILNCSLDELAQDDNESKQDDTVIIHCPHCAHRIRLTVQSDKE